VTLFNRGQQDERVAGAVKRIVGDRKDAAAFERRVREEEPFDVVIDMICYSPDEAESDVRAFGGRCGQFIFCSTVCTYGGKIPPGVAVDETFPQEPVTSYGRNKLACERIVLAAGEAGKFKTTVVRPSSTYGPGGNLIDNLEFNPAAWDRIERGLPVLCAGDGLGLWVSTHRDDVGKLFAYACGNPKTYGQSYNATREENFTWRDQYRQAAAAIGREAKLLFMSADWIVRHDPKRFALLDEITRYHGAYTSRKARRDVPEFRCEIGFERGAAETLADVRRRGAWRDSRGDAVYDAMVERALAAGVEPVSA
jgi:nucleoside-diphosphate-sugar epimerase